MPVTPVPMPHPAQAGRSMFEFLILVTLVGILGYILLERVVGIERESERAEVALTVRNLRTGLWLAVGVHMMRGQEDRQVELLDANPVLFLGHPPRGYTEDASEAARPGRWYFDPATRILTYHPRQPEAFAGREELRWKMASQGGSGGRIAGLRLESLPN